jgi:hypothetical protein
MTPFDSAGGEVTPAKPTSWKESKSWRSRDKVIYLVLFAVQACGAAFVICNDLPGYTQLVQSPGQQLADVPYDNYEMIAILAAMQTAYWYRFRCLAIPFAGPKLVLSHIFLFLGRLSFIFGSALFSIVLFRHLPALDPEVDFFLAARRGIFLFFSLFALFCTTLELERLGNALAEGDQR